MVYLIRFGLGDIASNGGLLMDEPRKLEDVKFELPSEEVLETTMATCQTSINGEDETIKSRLLAVLRS